MNCPTCGASNRPNAQFCKRCGSALTMNCPHCGVPNRARAQYCLHCGRALRQRSYARLALGALGGAIAVLLVCIGGALLARGVSETRAQGAGDTTPAPTEIAKVSATPTVLTATPTATPTAPPSTWTQTTTDLPEATAAPTLTFTPTSTPTLPPPTPTSPPPTRTRPPPTRTRPPPTRTTAPVGLQVGKMTPDFTLNDSGGKAVRLRDLHGKPVIINFWASWCGFCRDEMGDLNALYRDSQGRGLVVLGVTDDPDRSAAENFVRERGLTFLILWDGESAVNRTYNINAIPTSFFIDRQQIIRAVKFGYMTRRDMDTRFSLID